MDLTVIVGGLLAVARLIESVFELAKTPEIETIWGKIVQIVKNFLSIEKYEE